MISDVTIIINSINNNSMTNISYTVQIMNAIYIGDGKKMVSIKQ